MRRVFGAACSVVAVLAWASGAEAQDRTAWQIRAEIAVRKVVDDDVADRIRSILTAVGKNTRVRDITVEPDGEGVLSKIAIRWSGVVIALDYSAVVRWRFTRTAHISSGVESLVGLGIVTDHVRNALDDYLRTRVFPPVQTEAAKDVRDH